MIATKLRDELLVAKLAHDHIEAQAKKLSSHPGTSTAKNIIHDIIEAADCASQTALAALQDFDDGVKPQPATLPAPAKLPFDPSLAVAYGTSIDLNLALAQIRSVMAVINANGQAGFGKIDHFALLVAAAEIIEHRCETMDEVETVLNDVMEKEAGND
ncbi:hypothetical protein L1889_03700 [Paenalcaligenes niemegkensis]|uniref:hypothetical protein n=1 Tax=Paenalcaligenes niemegkensis TaxID=2895469 RepID=UPI001EE91C8F|nr:hypothetical protein [Paenalcaligenes niemegkensis]MCQ9615914.1 hypothetical protein [Paenalcaligenes niemegkensis]